MLKSTQWQHSGRLCQMACYPVVGPVFGSAIFGRRLGIIAAITLTLSGTLCSGPAFAQALLDQYIPPGGAGGGTAFQTVLSRPHPEYDSSGVRVGNVIIRPEVTENIGYDSNIFGSSQARGGLLINTHAALSAASDWSLSRLQTALSVDDIRYPTQSGQSYTNWAATIGGSHEFGRDIASVTYSHQGLTLTPQGLDVPQLQTPVPYTIDDLQIQYRINLPRGYLLPALDVSAFDFSDSANQGTNYSSNNRVVLSPSLTAGYDLSTQRSIVLVIRDADAGYTHKVAGNPGQDYNDVAVLGGLDYGANGVIRYRFLIGYELRTFRNAQYKTISAPIAEASAIWTPTGLTAITGVASRRILASTATVGGYTETALQLRVDHEYLPNVLFRANAGVFLDDYSTGGGSQFFYTAGSGITYLANRNLRLALNYDFSARETGNSGTLTVNGQTLGGSYTDHRILLQLRFGL